MNTLTEHMFLLSAVKLLVCNEQMFTSFLFKIYDQIKASEF